MEKKMFFSIKTLATQMKLVQCYEDNSKVINTDKTRRLKMIGGNGRKAGDNFGK